MIDPREHVIGKLVAYDKEEITVSTTAIGLTAANLLTEPKPKEVYIQCESASLRYFYDGSTPTSSSGYLMVPRDTIRIKGTVNMGNILFIRSSSTDAKLTVTYER